MQVKEYCSSDATIKLSKREVLLLLYWFETSNTKPNKEEKQLITQLEKLNNDMMQIEKLSQQIATAYNKHR